MESLSETKWDVVIDGTGLQNSLLALALSRSNKKILHVDENQYYGGTGAAFSLQEVDEWIAKVKGESPPKPFRNASVWKRDAGSLNESEKLSFSRAYTLTLSPQIIYTKSKLLAQLVSSKVYRQLEFQAVGNWWIFNGQSESPLKRIPNGREDIFQDKSLDNRAKRSLMKFLKFVVDYEHQREFCEPHAQSGMAGFLSSQFQLPEELQVVIAALAVSLRSPEHISVGWALPRIARHLTSIGVFGPGFGAVVPKWGGGAEIAQVACRAGAVGGGIYVLGTAIKSSETITEEDEQLIAASLSNGEIVKTKVLVGEPKVSDPEAVAVSKIIAVISSPFNSLFKSYVEGSPLAAISVVFLPEKTITVEGAQSQSIYIMVHSSETGECPAGQCVLYATTMYSNDSKRILEAAVTTFLAIVENGEAKLLYSLYYEQKELWPADSIDMSIDLAFNDKVLDEVEQQWKSIMGDNNAEESTAFMQFEDRQGMNDDDDADEVY